MEKLKYDLEEEKAQKSFYQAKHKEVSAELQNKTSQLEEAKKKVIALGKIHQHETIIALAFKSIFIYSQSNACLQCYQLNHNDLPLEFWLNLFHFGESSL